MTREELIQSPGYWKGLYENECWRLGVKPDKVGFIKLDGIVYKEGYNREEYINYLKNNPECSIDKLCEMVADLKEMNQKEHEEFMNTLKSLGINKTMEE